MCNIVVMKKIQLTMDILKDIPNSVIENDDMFLQNVLDIADDEYLIDQDYIYCELSRNGEMYTIIHGYPGDTAMGTVYKDNEFITNLHSYMDVGDDLNEFDFWYTSKYNDVYLTLDSES